MTTRLAFPARERTQSIIPYCMTSPGRDGRAYIHHYQYIECQQSISANIDWKRQITYERMKKTVQWHNRCHVRLWGLP